MKVVTISSWLNFGRPTPPRRGSVAERKFLAPPYYGQRAVFASLQVLFFIRIVVCCAITRLNVKNLNDIVHRTSTATVRNATTKVSLLGKRVSTGYAAIQQQQAALWHPGTHTHHTVQIIYTSSHSNNNTKYTCVHLNMYTFYGLRFKQVIYFTTIQKMQKNSYTCRNAGKYFHICLPIKQLIG